MYKLLLDADAVIKLTHAQVIYDVCNSFKCYITTEIEREAVKEGKERLYPDAEVVERLIKTGLLKVRSITVKEKDEKFGAGELSILELHKKLRGSLIVSDDISFLNYLEGNNVPFLIPTDLILLLKYLEKVSLKKALKYLNNMKVFIREDVYKETKKELLEEEK